MSNIESGKAGKLKPSTIFALSEVNRRIAQGDWGPVKSHEIKDALKAAQPLVGDDGEPWAATDFWACLVGLKEPPAAYRQDPPPALRELDATRLSEGWRQQVQDLVLSHDLDPVEALQRPAASMQCNPTQCDLLWSPGSCPSTAGPNLPPTHAPFEASSPAWVAR